jgi:hypothetical protein
MVESQSFEQDRVRQNTADEINDRIDAGIRETVSRYATASPHEISQRIGELESEWDIERVLETNAASLALSGIVSAALGRRRGLLLAGGVLGFLLYHATQGWCPPLPILRRLGVRTRREIEREKFVLKYLRGDFEGLSVQRARKAPDKILAAVAQ